MGRRSLTRHDCDGDCNCNCDGNYDCDGACWRTRARASFRSDIVASASMRRDSMVAGGIEAFHAETPTLTASS